MLEEALDFHVSGDVRHLLLSFLENGELEGNEEPELNGVVEGRDEMPDEEGDSVEELAAPDWRVRAGPRKRREEHEATHVPFRHWCAHSMMGRGRTHHHDAKQKKSEDQSRRPTVAMDHYFMKTKSVLNAQTFSHMLGYLEITLKSDTEPAIVAFRNRVAEMCKAEVTTEDAVKGDEGVEWAHRERGDAAAWSHTNHQVSH